MTRALLLGCLALALAACVPERYTQGPPRASAPPPARSDGAVVVRPGDSLSVIAQREGVSTRAMADANALRAPYVVRPGQRLVVPRAAAASVSAPAASAPPAIAPASPQAEAGDTPSRSNDRVERQALPPPAAPQAAAPSAATPPSAAQAPRQDTAATPGRGADDAAPPPRASRLFLWPVQGRIVSDFGPKPGGLRNDGINIAAARGAPIHAAENGVVVYAGNELRGFGNLLLVRHADGWVTAYGHCEQLLVRRGQQVRRGQTIARVGSTGNVRTPQLHFEVRRGTRPENPNEFLEQ